MHVDAFEVGAAEGRALLALEAVLAAVSGLRHRREETLQLVGAQHRAQLEMGRDALLVQLELVEIGSVVGVDGMGPAEVVVEADTREGVADQRRTGEVSLTAPPTTSTPGKPKITRKGSRRSPSGVRGTSWVAESGQPVLDWWRTS